MRLGLGILGLRQTRVRARARLRVLRWHGTLYFQGQQTWNPS